MWRSLGNVLFFFFLLFLWSFGSDFVLFFNSLFIMSGVDLGSVEIVGQTYCFSFFFFFFWFFGKQIGFVFYVSLVFVLHVPGTVSCVVKVVFLERVCNI